MTPIERAEVAEAYDSFPCEIRNALLRMRDLILTVGKRIEPIGRVEESLKWGEPSYATISGSPVRLGWNKKAPERYAIYFHCRTKLISTFRALYPNTFSFEGNRAITFLKSDQVPVQELEHCLELALSYHRVKDKPLLGTKENGRHRQPARSISSSVANGSAPGRVRR